MNKTMTDNDNISLSPSEPEEKVYNFEIQLITNKLGGVSGRIFLSYAEINEETSAGDFSFNNEVINVRGMMFGELAQITVKAKNVRFDEVSNANVHLDGLEFEPDTTIHQEKMVTFFIGTNQDMVDEENDQNESSSRSQLESCSSMSKESQILLPGGCQEPINLDNSEKLSYKSINDNPKDNESRSRTTLGDDSLENSNTPNESDSTDQSSPPPVLYLNNNIGDLEDL